MAKAELSSLSRTGGAAAATIQNTPMPSRRLLTRLGIPLLVLLIALGLLAYAARETLRPALAVTTAPVVLKVGGASGGTNAVPVEIVQAPGWIEADPYAVSVPSLLAGVIKEITVLEGERIEKGQVVARLIDDDAVLARRRAELELARAQVAIEQARAAVLVEEAKVEEARELWERVAPLAGGRAISEEEVAARRLRLASQRASVAVANAGVSRALAEVAVARIMLEEAELALSRTEVRAPIAGMVLVRLVEPGQRLMPDANNPYAGVVVRLYDPAHLQVRVDVPLADAAKVAVGDTVEASTEALPNRTFKGTISRFVHEANLQKNTVQVKVAIADPAAELKPEMLTKVRILTQGRAATAGSGGSPAASSGAGGLAGPSGPVVLAPRGAIVEVAGTEAWAWVVDLPTGSAQKRRLKLGLIAAESAEVLDGLRPGDRVILDPPATLAPGTKVRATETTKEL